MIDRRPALIAKCAGAADIIAAVRFAREQTLIFSIKGGGHNVTGNAVCEGGLVRRCCRNRCWNLFGAASG
jgi:FAD/FMN-containing dehydrogenase